MLSTSYPSSELMPYKGSTQFPDQDKEVVEITLREAAKKAQGNGKDKIKCNCSSTCKKGRCSCRLAGFNCTSHCHPKNSSCLNRESEPKVVPVMERRKRKLERRTECKIKRKKFISTSSLCNESIEMLKSNNWLGDEHIEAANCLLRSKFPNLIGLYNPVLGQD